MILLDTTSRNFVRPAYLCLGHAHFSHILVDHGMYALPETCETAHGSAASDARHGCSVRVDALRGGHCRSLSWPWWHAPEDKAMLAAVVRGERRREVVLDEAPVVKDKSLLSVRTRGDEDVVLV